MARTPDGSEQISDEQRALDLYLLAEKKYYESPESSPDDATLLHTMALALLTRQLYRMHEQMQPLHKDIAMLRETMDTTMRPLIGKTLYRNK
jgi:hypothetical protein